MRVYVLTVLAAVAVVACSSTTIVEERAQVVTIFIKGLSISA